MTRDKMTMKLLYNLGAKRERQARYFLGKLIEERMWHRRDCELLTEARKAKSFSEMGRTIYQRRTRHE